MPEQTGPYCLHQDSFFQEEEAHCPAPRPALAYKGQKGAQQMPTLTLSPLV